MEQVSQGDLIRGVALVGATLLVSAAHAQSCGLTSMQDSVKLVYPPIAKAAHVQGPVVLMTTFRLDGPVAGATPITGPEMLRASAVTYVKGLRANVYSGPRQCPIVVTFRFQEEPHSCDQPTDLGTYIPRFEHTDLQHVALTVKPACLYSQPALSAQQ